MSYEMRFAGSGGQGVILASIVIAEAAVEAGLETVQSQAYGPEARGGSSKAETIISRRPIRFSKVTRPNFLLALTQSSFEKYSADLAPEALVIVDSTLEIPEEMPGAALLPLPILETARDKVGRAMTANIVAVGAINAALGLFDGKTLLNALLRHVPAGTEELNSTALREGAALIPSGWQVPGAEALL